MGVETALCSICSWWRTARESRAALQVPPRAHAASPRCSAGLGAGGVALRRGGEVGCLSALPLGASSSPEPGGKPFGSAADVLADVCADMGVRFETTDPEEVRSRCVLWWR